MIKVALVGLGMIGETHARVLRTWGASMDLRLVATVDSDPKNGGISGIPHFQDLRGLLAAEELRVDAVSIATPPSTHYALARSALMAGKHVLLEKPPTVTIEESEELIQLSRRYERVLVMGFHSRHSPLVHELKKWRRLDEVRVVTVRFSVDLPKYFPPSHGSWDPANGGGILMDSGINVLSVLTDLFPGEPLALKRAKLWSSPPYRVEIGAILVFMIGERHCYLHMDGTYPRPVISYLFSGVDQAKAQMNFVTNTLMTDGCEVFSASERKGDVFKNIHAEEYSGVYREFARSVMAGSSSTSLRELAFIHAAYDSAD